MWVLTLGTDLSGPLQYIDTDLRGFAPDDRDHPDLSGPLSSKPVDIDL